MSKVIHISKNIILDGIVKQDIPDLVSFLNDRELYDNTLSVPYPYNKSDAEEFLQNATLFEAEFNRKKDWAIRYKGQLVGGIGLLFNYGVDSPKSEMGYWLAKPFRGNGYMSAIVEGFSNWVFKNTNLKRLEASVFDFNHASKRVLEKAGYIQKEFRRNAFLKDGKHINAYFFIKDRTSKSSPSN